jgi:DNA-binding transcriptional LysR family regulator
VGEELYRHGSELIRLAYEAELAVERITTGWEPELHIAIHDFFPADKIIQLAHEFYEVAPKTHLFLTKEVMTGAWDALLSGRADIVLAMGKEISEGGGFSVYEAGEVEFVFVVSPEHPLARFPEPIPDDELRKHRVVAIADTAKNIPTKSIFLLPGQQVLTVSSPEMKIEAHLQGLGVGTVPRAMVQQYLQSGRLVVKALESGSAWRFPLVYAWKNKDKGQALTWLIKRLCDPKRTIDWFGD